MFWNSMHDSEQFKVANICAFKKILVHSKVLQWEHRIYLNKGTKKEMVVWIVRSQSNISVNHQWIKKITYKKKEAPVMKVTMVMNL